jgi:hypothetical protein
VRAAPGRRSGCQLLNWTSDNSTVVAKPKNSLLPVLIALFLFSYGLMALLVVEQGRTIDSQRNLIRSLFDDSSQLTQMKGKAFQKQHAEAQAQAQAKAHSQAQTPSAQTPPAPSTQAPLTQTPLAQDSARGNAKGNHGASKSHKAVPQKPPAGVSDITDERRTVNLI